MTFDVGLRSLAERAWAGVIALSITDESGNGMVVATGGSVEEDDDDDDGGCR